MIKADFQQFPMTVSYLYIIHILYKMMISLSNDKHKYNTITRCQMFEKKIKKKIINRFKM